MRESWRASRPRDSRWCGVAWGGPWPLEGRETAPRPSVVWVVRCSRVRPARSRRGSCGTAGAPRGRSAEGFLHGSRIRAFAGLPSLGAAPPLRAGWWSSVLPPPPVCLVPPRVASSAARLRRLPSAFSPGPPASVSRQPGRPFGVVSLPVRRFPIPVGGFRFRLPPRCVSSAAGPPRPSLPAAPRLTDGVLCFRVCGRDGRGWSYVFGVLRIAAAGPAGVGGRLPGPSPFPRVVPAIPLGGTLAPRGAFALTGLSLLPSSVPHSGTFLGSPTPEKRRREGVGGKGKEARPGKRREERKEKIVGGGALRFIGLWVNGGVGGLVAGVSDPRLLGAFLVSSPHADGRALPTPLPLSGSLGSRSLSLSLSLPHLSLSLSRPRSRSYLVDPASSICLSQRLSHACLSTHGRYSETANGSLNQLWFLWSLAPLLLG